MLNMSRGEMSWGETSRGQTDERAKHPVTGQLDFGVNEMSIDIHFMFILCHVKY